MFNYVTFQCTAFVSLYTEWSLNRAYIGTLSLSSLNYCTFIILSVLINWQWNPKTHIPALLIFLYRQWKTSRHHHIIFEFEMCKSMSALFWNATCKTFTWSVLAQGRFWSNFPWSPFFRIISSPLPVLAGVYKKCSSKADDEHVWAVGPH